MKRRLTILTLTALAAVALVGVVWTAPSPALAGGATQISGVAFSTKMMSVTLEVWAPTSPSS